MADQVFPPGTEAYELLATGQCDSLLHQIRDDPSPPDVPTTVSWKKGGVPDTLTDLYVAAGEACLANWGPAQDAFQRVSTAKLCERDFLYSTGESCKEVRLRVYRWTENLLSLYNADHAFVPNFPPPPPPAG